MADKEKSNPAAPAKPAQPTGPGMKPPAGGERMVQIPAGTLQFLKQFLQANPDLAKEASLRLNAVMNRQQIGMGNRMMPPGNQPDVKNQYQSAVGKVQSANLKTKAAPKADGAQ